MLPDGITPRVWKMSEMGSGYHKKGDSSPKIGGLHPRCRCIYDRYAPVVTEQGVKPLCKIKIGDRVLTHTGKFKKVLGTFGEKGLPSDGEDLFRIEFKAPNGRSHKLRVTGDHLMMKSSGEWVRADEIVSGDKLQYLFPRCEACSRPFAHDIRQPKKRFCSMKCASTRLIGNKLGAGRVKKPEEIRKWATSLENTVSSKRQARIEPQQFECAVCHEGFTRSLGYVGKSGRWTYRKPPRTCSTSCSSREVAQKQWKDPAHRAKVTQKNSESMRAQYLNGTRDARSIASARRALYASGKGPSKDQKRLYDRILANYPDAVLDTMQIGKYWPDIAIPSLKVIVEWDGGGHWLCVYKGEKTMEQKIAEDAERDDFLRSEGWHVLRYNEQTGMDSVLADIHLAGLNSTNGYTFGEVVVDRVVRVPHTHKSRLARIYDITVEDDSSFVVMGLVSHNCLLALCPLDFGFDKSGNITYIGKGHDEYEVQRGLNKAEPNIMDGVSPAEAVSLAPPAHIDFSKIDWKEWIFGIEHEREHAKVVDGDPLKIAQIAADHLHEDPDYYRKLRTIEPS